LRVAAFSGASRFERKKNALPSRVHSGDVSFFSAVNVICFVDGTPCATETR
jgi:hypothetical protein